MQEKQFGLIIPFYNFTSGASAALNRILTWKKNNALNFILYLVDDGSADETPAVLKNFQEENSAWCEVLLLQKNLGKGAAIRAAFLELSLKVETIIFTDCDLHYGLNIIQERLLPELQSADIVIADRSWIGSSSHQAVSRRISSYLFNRIMGLFTGVTYRDSQAGMKAFRAQACKPIFEILRVNGFTFDVEILTIAIFYRLVIRQVSIAFPDTHQFPQVSSVSLFKNSLQMILDLIRINLNWKKGKYYHIELEKRVNQSIYAITDCQ